MKRFLVMIITIAAFYGCKKDKSYSSLIVGRWNHNKDSIAYYQNGVFSTNSVSNSTSGYYMEFIKDGTGKDNYRSFTYSISGATVAITGKSMPVFVNGPPPTIETSNATISLLTENKLILEYDYTSANYSGQFFPNKVYSFFSK